MIIDIDGKLVTVPAHIEGKIIEQLFLMVEELYQNEIPKPGRIAMKVYSRKKIADMEARMNAQGLDGKAIRPPDGEDPNLHYLRLMFASSQKVLRDAILLIDTEPDPANKDAVTATTFNLSIAHISQTGGPIVVSGDTGERKNGSGDNARPGAGAAIPEQSTLHL